jgi:hypothetical protein
LAEHIKVTLEHHFNRRYHSIKQGPGRRPSAVAYGNFNLRYRDPQLGGKRVRVTLDVSGLTAALEARRKKEMELNALPAERKVTCTLQRVADKYLAEIQCNLEEKNTPSLQRGVEILH